MAYLEPEDLLTDAEIAERQSRVRNLLFKAEKNLAQIIPTD